MNAMEQAIGYVLDRAKAGKVAAEVLATERTTTSVEMQARKLEKFQFSETREIGVRVVNGRNEGIAYSESLESDALDEMLEQAVGNSRMIEKETAADLRAGGELPAMEFLFNRALQETPVESKMKTAAAMESAAWDFDQRISNVHHATYRDVWWRQTIANTNGLHGSFQANSCAALLGCLAKDGDATVQGFEAAFARELGALEAETLARKVAGKTLQRIGATRPVTGRYTAVIDARVAETLIGLLSDYFSAKEVDEKSSPLAGRLGDQVFSNRLTLTDDPFQPLAPGSRPFDDEGFSSQKVVLVENGRLMRLLTNSVLAKKMGLPHTAHAARSPSADLAIAASNLVVTPGDRPREELLKADGKVILITRILGAAGFRRASGDFSLPVEGLLYENGHLTGALKDFLISGNLIQLFHGVEAVGNDVMPPVGTNICPSLLVRDLNISGRA